MKEEVTRKLVFTFKVHTMFDDAAKPQEVQMKLTKESKMVFGGGGIFADSGLVHA